MYTKGDKMTTAVLHVTAPLGKKNNAQKSPFGSFQRRKYAAQKGPPTVPSCCKARKPRKITNSPPGKGAVAKMQHSMDTTHGKLPSIVLSMAAEPRGLTVLSWADTYYLECIKTCDGFTIFLFSKGF